MGNPTGYEKGLRTTPNPIVMGRARISGRLSRVLRAVSGGLRPVPFRMARNTSYQNPKEGTH